MKRWQLLIMGLTAGLVFFLLQGASRAGGPTEHVRAILEDVMAIQTDPNLQGNESRNEKKLAIKKVIGRNFHFDAMARESLGEGWGKLNEAERTEFRTLFQSLLEESYSKLVLDFLGKEKVQYAKEERSADKALVKTVILRSNEEIAVDYELTRIEGKWLVQDVRIDGVSIVQNYRKSFAKAIRQESYAGLLRKMRLQNQADQKSP